MMEIQVCVLQGVSNLNFFNLVVSLVVFENISCSDNVVNAHQFV
jgi:hypothetical protein